MQSNPHSLFFGIFSIIQSDTPVRLPAVWRAFLKGVALVLFCALPCISEAQTPRADRDGNGLIEIDSPLMLHNMRYNLAGTSYRTTGTASVVGNDSGCPATGCVGYELTQHLDFDVDGDGSSWSGNSDSGYSLDSGDSQAEYFPVDNNGAGGWQPIGEETTPFIAVFDGNGYSLSNLAIRRDQPLIGLFGAIGEGAAIRNLGLVDNLTAYIGADGDSSYTYIGSLVGRQGGGSIRTSHATGPVAGADGASDFVGGLVGQQRGGSISASHATGAVVGGDGDYDVVGGLVGWQGGGLITASYATGDAAGGGGAKNDVGGLVGWLQAGSITASYATGDAAGGDGDYDDVGGLVGCQTAGTITATYARGAAHGGGGNRDDVGGLAGCQDGGSIRASYATGAAHGGDGDDDYAGALTGRLGGGSVTASYGFGRSRGRERGGFGGSTPRPVSRVAELTEANVGSVWNNVDIDAHNAWNLGTGVQVPLLNYADYDGFRKVFDCDQFPAGACGTLLPRQAGVSASGPSAVVFGTTATLTGSLAFGRVAVVSWSWEQLQGPTVTLRGADTRTATFRAPATSALLLFKLTATDSEGDEYTDRIPLSLGASVDQDGDGLIEIRNLTMLHNMRYNLAGTSYSTGTASVGSSFGCPAARCRGYELMQDLNFDVDDDGSTWSGSGAEGYRLDVGDSRADYFPVENGAGGWLPIGDGRNPFVAVFDGNSHTISNLAIRRDQTYVGLFGMTRSGAVIRNLGLSGNLADYIGSGNDYVYIGGLVGRLRGGSITASHVLGDAAGGDGGNDFVGGLAGRQSSGSSIAASHAAGDVAGGSGSSDRVGALVGQQDGGSITASYAAGGAAGGSGGSDRVGALVGQQDGGLITASYATGDADGGSGDFDHVGALIGRRGGGSITASYATGDAAGGIGDYDDVGALVGWQGGGSIVASYAVGDADGGRGARDSAGALVGRHRGGLITESYGFGVVAGGESGGLDGTPGSVSSATGLTAANAGSAWNSADSHTLGAWDFGTDGQIPALNYADYDGTGTVFVCGPNSRHFLSCDALLPGQADVDTGGYATAGPGESFTLAGSLKFGRITIESWSWRQLAGPEVPLSHASAREATFTAPAANALLVFELTATGSGGGQYADRITLVVADEVDRDSNGLIEIDNLTMLHDIRYNLEGTSYRTGTASVGNSAGCPDTGCIGYELTRNLDFDVNGDGSTWSGNGGYTLDPADSQADYFPVNNDGTGGWLPIGDGKTPFVAVFNGNGYSLSNLAIRRDLAYIGLFGAIGGGAVVYNLGLIDNLAAYTGSSNGDIYIGGLVGEQGSGSIMACQTTGDAAGGGGGYDIVGGLVGWQRGGSITASHTMGDAFGGGGSVDIVGALVGWQGGGSISASYATGVAGGGDGGYDEVGALVGWQSSGSITASYAVGDASGGSGDHDRVGGLVGVQSGTITASYGFGRILGREIEGSDGSAKPEGVRTVAELTATNAGSAWNSADSGTLGAWDFDASADTPLLNYADYDGADGGVFDCMNFPANACDTLVPAQEFGIDGDSGAAPGDGGGGSDPVGGDSGAGPGDGGGGSDPVGGDSGAAPGDGGGGSDPVGGDSGAGPGDGGDGSDPDRGSGADSVEGGGGTGSGDSGSLDLLALIALMLSLLLGWRRRRRELRGNRQ